jgi:chromosome segregation ATPase
MSTNLSQNYFKDFQNLIEIQSLEALIAAQNKILEGEKQRETFLSRQKSQKQTRLNELEVDLKSLQKLLEEKEKSHSQNQTRINRIKENLLAVTDNKQLINLENEQKTLTIADQEEEILFIS